MTLSTTYGAFAVKDYGFGMRIMLLSNGKDVWLQGDDASHCRDELDDLFKDHAIAGTRASRFTERELAYEILGCYFD